MFNLRMIGCSVAECLRKWNHQPRKAACLLLSIVFLCGMGYLYIGTLHQAGLTMSLLEPLLAVLLMPVSSVVVVCSILAMNAEAPFFDLNDALTIHRLGRLNWATGRLVYLLAFALLSPFALCILAIVAFAPFTHGVNQWTETITALSIDRDVLRPLVHMPLYQVPFIPTNIITNLPPVEVLLLQCLLTGLLSAGMSMLMMVLNMTYNRNIGAVLCFALLLITPALTNSTGGFLHYLPTVASNLSYLPIIRDSRQIAQALTSAFWVNGVLILLSCLLMILRAARHSFKWGE